MSFFYGFTSIMGEKHKPFKGGKGKRKLKGKY